MKAAACQDESNLNMMRLHTPDKQCLDTHVLSLGLTFILFDHQWQCSNIASAFPAEISHSETWQLPNNSSPASHPEDIFNLVIRCLYNYKLYWLNKSMGLSLLMTFVRCSQHFCFSIRAGPENSPTRSNIDRILPINMITWLQWAPWEPAGDI
jgi:hypothetical protein